MSKPYIHSLSSVKRHGGVPEDYMPIHEFMDSSKSVIADNRHRALTHNAWFISVVIPAVFGETMVNSDGKTISTRDIAEEHCIEDFHGFIPSAQDFIDHIPAEEWMNGRGVPPRWATVKKPKGGRIGRTINTISD